MVLFKLNQKLRSLAKFALPIAGAALLIAGLQSGAHQAKAGQARNLHDLHVKDQSLNCQTCHSPNQSIKKEACQDCHDVGEMPGYLKQFSDQAALPGMTPRPSDHAQDWRRAHGPQAKV